MPLGKPVCTTLGEGCYSSAPHWEGLFLAPSKNLPLPPTISLTLCASHHANLERGRGELNKIKAIIISFKQCQEFAVSRSPSPPQMGSFPTHVTTSPVLNCSAPALTFWEQAPPHSLPIHSPTLSEEGGGLLPDAQPPSRCTPPGSANIAWECPRRTVSLLLSSGQILYGGSGISYCE